MQDHLHSAAPSSAESEAGDGPQPLDAKTSTKHCSVFEVTVHGVLLHFFFFGGVLCLSILESLPPFDFSGLPTCPPTENKT